MSLNQASRYVASSLPPTCLEMLEAGSSASHRLCRKSSSCPGGKESPPMHTHQVKDHLISACTSPLLRAHCQPPDPDDGWATSSVPFFLKLNPGQSPCTPTAWLGPALPFRDHTRGSLCLHIIGSQMLHGGEDRLCHPLGLRSQQSLLSKPQVPYL